MNRKYPQPLPFPLSEYKSWIAIKKYWDDYSHEWKESTIEKKLIHLAGFVKQGGDLNEVLTDYAEGRDESYRIRIQYCIFRYIERLLSGSRFKQIPIIERIQRLDKEELVKLLSEELCRSVVEVHDYDVDLKEISYWTITDEYINNDDILDKIEREHWRNNPNESFSFYISKKKRWDLAISKSMW